MTLERKSSLLTSYLRRERQSTLIPQIRIICTGLRRMWTIFLSFQDLLHWKFITKTFLSLKHFCSVPVSYEYWSFYGLGIGQGSYR